MSELAHKHCVPCEGGVSKLDRAQVEKHLQQLKDWRANASFTEIHKEYTFKNYYQVLAFVNAVAWIAHQEDHHPDISFGYKTCAVHYQTHAIQGLSENDFICAAKVDQLGESSS